MAVEKLTGLAWGIIMFAVVIALGLLVLAGFKTSAATCATAYTYNSTLEKCLNSTGGDATDPTNAAWSGVDYVGTQLGSTGLAGWLPVIIVVVVAGLIFLLFGKGGNY